MIAWGHTQENAIHTWVVAGSGLSAEKVIWSQQGGDRPARPFIEIRCSSVNSVGPDWLETEDSASPSPGAEIERHSRGARIARLSIQCFADAVGASSSVAILENVLASVSLPTHVDALYVAGVGVGDSDPVRSVGVPMHSAIFEPRAILELNLHLASDVFETATYIQTATLVNEIPKTFTAARLDSISTLAGSTFLRWAKGLNATLRVDIADSEGGPSVDSADYQLPEGYGSVSVSDVLTSVDPGDDLLARELRWSIEQDSVVLQTQITHYFDPVAELGDLLGLTLSHVWRGLKEDQVGSADFTKSGTTPDEDQILSWLVDGNGITNRGFTLSEDSDDWVLSDDSVGDLSDADSSLIGIVFSMNSAASTRTLATKRDASPVSGWEALVLNTGDFLIQRYPPGGGSATTVGDYSDNAGHVLIILHDKSRDSSSRYVFTTELEQISSLYSSDTSSAVSMSLGSKSFFTGADSEIALVFTARGVQVEEANLDVQDVAQKLHQRIVS